ncbi:hypothetical protein KKF70_06010 [bacterium]|nr:hypothetical protein [bacterium]
MIIISDKKIPLAPFAKGGIINKDFVHKRFEPLAVCPNKPIPAVAGIGLL